MGNLYEVLLVSLALTSVVLAQDGNGGEPADNLPDGFCEDPGVPENGFRIGNDLSRGGSGVFFICNNGFTISGNERSMCRLDGTWTTPVPLCVGGAVIQPTVSPPCRVQNYGSPPSGMMRRIDNFILYDCDFNHRLLGARNVSCFESSPRLPRCVWIQANPCQIGNGGCDQLCLNEGGLPLCKCNPPLTIRPESGSECESCPCECPDHAVDVVIVLDEGSINLAVRRWLFDLIGHLEQELVQNGYGTAQSCGNLYGMVAYGGDKSPENEKGRLILSLQGAAMSNWTNFLDVLGNIASEPISVGRSDGYAAIKHGLDRLPRRTGCSSVNTLMLHLSLRDRVILDAECSKDLLQQRLRFEDIVLQSFVQNQFSSSSQPAFGVYQNGAETLVAYMPSQRAFYGRRNTSVVVGDGFGKTVEDYVSLTLESGGGVYNGRFASIPAATRPLAVAIVDDSIRGLGQRLACSEGDACRSSPCANGGTCTSGLSGYECLCAGAFSGDRCQFGVCSNNPCSGNGRCSVAENGAAVCQCFGGYSGETCGVRNADICAILDCQNGGTCQVAASGNPRCDCPPGLTGPRCMQADESCAVSNPCVNGGRCIDTVEGIQCNCPDRFRGSRCERDLCSAVTCYNRGACAVVQRSARCVCVPGFMGPQCLQTTRDRCTPNPCQNAGRCSNSPTSFQCDCPRRYGGNACETDACRPITSGNEGYCEQALCRELSCRNAATCRIVSGEARCFCASGFRGPTCSDRIEQCSPSSCLNGGTCTNTASGFSCNCLPRFGSDRCQADFCEGLLCQNGGQCEVLSGGSTRCRCPAGVSGSLCQQVLSTCATLPCRNRATCVPVPTGFACLCRPGYYGQLCESFSSCELAGGCADIAFVIDESKSSRTLQDWLPQLITSLERRMMASQLGMSSVCRNRYGIVGFGRRVPQENARIYSTISGENMMSAEEASTLALELTSDDEGRLEDGYEALTVAIDNLSYRNLGKVEKFIVFASDEDRDVFGTGRRITRQQVISKLQQGGFSLYAVVDNRLTTQRTNGLPALGVTSSGPWYTTGGCNVNQANTLGFLTNGFSETIRDYATLAMEVGGGTFDIRHLGTTPDSNTCALTSSLEQAIVADACRVEKLPVRAVVDQASSQVSASPGQCTDTVFIVDESRAMGTEHRWLPTLVRRLEEELNMRGFGRPGVDACRNHYAAVGFARSAPNEHGHLIQNSRGEHLVTVEDFPELASFIREDRLGRTEDGYEAIKFALDNVNLRQYTSRSMFHTGMVLISDEDRDNTPQGTDVTFESLQQQLQQLGISLHVIVDQTFTFGQVGALGTDRQGQRSYLPALADENVPCQAMSVFGTMTFGRGFSRTNEHYTRLAMSLGGSAWNDNMLKNEQSSLSLCTMAKSVSRAVVDSIRQKQVPGTIPRCVDTVLVVDVSRNTEREHTWMRQALPHIHTWLQANGYGDDDTCQNHYGVVVFGQTGSNVNGVILFNTAGKAMVTMNEFSEISDQVQADRDGSIEDGYEALHVALVDLPLRRDANVFRQVVLISDEDRDVSARGRDYSKETISSLLANAGFHAIVDNSMLANGNPALGVALEPRHGFYSMPNDWFTGTTQGVVVQRGYARTNEHYVQLAIDLRGSAWDVKQFRQPTENESAANALAFSMVYRLNELMATRDLTEPTQTDPPPAQCWFGSQCNLCEPQYVGTVLGEQICCSECARGYANITENQGCNCIAEDVGCADILVVMDESKNTMIEHRWLPQLVEYLEQQLLARRIGDTRRYRQCPNLYSLVGFGRRDVVPHIFRDARALDSVSARDFIVLASSLASDPNGFVEDGYHALDYALERTMWRMQRGVNGPPVTRVILLVTDEDWDQTGPSRTLSTTVMNSILRRSGARLHAVVDQRITATGANILGLSQSGQGYRDAGRGQYRQVNSASLGSGFARTTEHYSNLALDLGGSVWDIIKLRETSMQPVMTSAIGDTIVQSAVQDLETMRGERGPQPILRPPRSFSNGRCWVGDECNSCDQEYHSSFVGQPLPQLCCAYCAKGNATIVPVSSDQFGTYTCSCQVDQGNERDR
ncbi:uncharacterized protein LOC135808421 [Sycon ciliatum]|uniref:uncharacterized protein LOC135808421 n=1 Tax=Sycon ciliatum TaxID=27933 RepID=UPI0031F6B2A1